MSVPSASVRPTLEHPRRFPKFDSPSELKGTPWELYLKELYGSASIKDPSAYPIDVNEFFMLRADHLKKAGLNFSSFSDGKCPHKELMLIENMAPLYAPTPQVLWVFHDLTDVKPLSSDAWVEVIHGVPPSDQQPETQTGYWMYYAPGSGISYNLRKTIAFNSHNEAVKFFVDETIECSPCDAHFAEMCNKARRRGFQSIQFLHQVNQRCGHTAIELVDVVFSGSFVCLPMFLGGRGDSRCPCICSEDDKTRLANCKLSWPQLPLRTRARGTRHSPTRWGERAHAEGALHVDVQASEDTLMDEEVAFRRYEIGRLDPPEPPVLSGTWAGSTMIVGGSMYNTLGFSMEGEVKVATFNAASLELGSPSYLAMALASLNVDVIAVQEDIGTFAANGKTLHTFLHVPGFDVVASCAGEKLSPAAGASAWGGHVVANSLLVRRDKWEAFRTEAVTISVGCYTRRCAAIADLRRRDGGDEPRRLRVASTHLCGGHYADDRWEQIKGEKELEVRVLVSMQPDLILGDMNSYITPKEAERHAAAGSYGPYLRAVDQNLTSEYLGWSSGACAVLNKSHYTLLLGDVAMDSSIRGGMPDQIWFHSGHILGSGLDMVATRSDHRIVHGRLNLRPDSAQLSHESFLPLFVMLLPGVVFIATGVIANWRAQPRTKEATGMTSLQPNSIWACGFAMFFLKGLCQTLLPLCFAAWVAEGSPLEVICYTALAARFGTLLGTACWGGAVDAWVAPGAAAAVSHAMVAAGAAIMVRSVGSTIGALISAQFLIAFGCSAETPLSQLMITTYEDLGAQFAYLQVGFYVGGFYASILFMACAPLEPREVLQAAYSVVLMLADLIPVALFACRAFSQEGDPVRPGRSTFWKRWKVTPMYWLVVLQATVSASANYVGGFLLVCVASASLSSVSSKLLALQCFCSAVGSFFFGWWSDRLAAQRGGHRARVVAGRVGCTAAMFAVAIFCRMQEHSAGRWMLLTAFLLAVKALSEDAAYVGATGPLLVGETQPSCAIAAMALKNVLDSVVAALSGPLVLLTARFFGYAASNEPSEVAKQVGKSIACIYITLRFMELAVYRVMYRRPKST